jgi:DNA-damage-inducible protein J
LVATRKEDDMAKEATARARMDAALKEEAEGILAECGLNATQGINLFYRQVVLHRGLPFDVRIPNAESREALHEIETGEGLVRFGSADELFRDLEI